MRVCTSPPAPPLPAATPQRRNAATPQSCTGLGVAAQQDLVDSLASTSSQVLISGLIYRKLLGYGVAEHSPPPPLCHPVFIGAPPCSEWGGGPEHLRQRRLPTLTQGPRRSSCLGGFVGDTRCDTTKPWSIYATSPNWAGQRSRLSLILRQCQPTIPGGALVANPETPRASPRSHVRSAGPPTGDGSLKRT